MTFTDSETTTPTPEHHDRPVSKYGPTMKMVVLVFGVLLLQLGFILSYVAAFHQPTPREIEIAVIAARGLPAGMDQQIADRLNAIEGRPLDARVVMDTAQARQLLRDREIQGAFVVDPTGTDILVTASAGGSSISSALETVFTQVENERGHQFTVRDEIPVGVHDNRGLSGFYLAVGWVVGGYLLAAAIGLFIGAPRTLRQAGAHAAVLFGYSVLSGALGALITTYVLGTFSGHWFPLWLLGTGVVFGTAMFTLGLRAAVGIVAVPLAIAVFVILGNPSAGGAFGSNVIPSFYATIGRWITPGAGTEGIRSILYFDHVGLGQPALALTLYSLIGLGLLFGSTARRDRKSESSTPRSDLVSNGAS
ncbi:ABC transporter permease [Rhodococcus marinonascens]|uniref:ABC transporter permease n=1 Tax=Rhodococcus marinonascens TaxID=38311 RepID=UPI000933DE2F|nr:ABC transporter permease [Rhodococcus marinonascens]